MTFLRSVLLNIFILLWTPLVGVPGIVLVWFNRRKVKCVTTLWARGVVCAAQKLTGIRYQVLGREHLPQQGSYIFACKHQSAWETISILMLLDNPAIVLKQELLKLPVFGWYARHSGMIPVDRSGSSKALRTMLRAAEEAKAQGRPIVIFPEGTRSAPGTRPELHPGMAGLYAFLNLPLVPAALNSGLVWGRESFTKYPGMITVQIHPAIAPGLSRADMTARVHAAINSLEEEGSSL
ncbi:lysophospholipid acyltransferase family protein [Pedomonas mirosovicensis]|uniref:lysophospholipid acyltransferase family protein n=1 Tax=Pedomonas mirosovicensis TaxID=2908641 RepID=UPI002167124F|nr:lysophospholipid acyltransferase family protein [Pedomonas mirosovicensis]MCH8684970.1 1-acyl-sn-glycerol-3-phosphate acyltransferase [Pedomonas mirosovicensis]